MEEKEKKDTEPAAPIKEVPTQPEQAEQAPPTHKHKKAPKTLGEKLIPWGQFIGIVSGALLAVYASFFKGEPIARKTWEVLRDQVNQQSEVINKLHLRMVFLQAHQEGQTAAALQLKLDQLQEKHNTLLKQFKAPASQPVGRPCRPGFQRTPEGRCVKQVTAAPSPSLDTMKKALEEEKKRLEVERKKSEKIRKSVEQTKKGGGDKMLQSLPTSPSGDKTF